MPPGNDRAMRDRIPNYFPNLGVISLSKFLGEIQVVPADNAVFDQTLTPFSHLLLLLLDLQDFSGIADRDCPSEVMSMFNLVKLALNRLSRLNIIDVAKDEQGFDDLAKGLQRPIKRVLLGVRI